ncbi:hypothetical protein F8O06_05015 [Pseudoclavibacter sp. CFCC 14310]|uniref:hypothetical protein n=1 Tax=Pseudoclavibacter sp. CFCC 14310 TaxID=2615180 RepID=UPI001301460A|nr:hypothetical protein [Pseudoclavibacter sp. CFCC 14310]KAB1645415.1 hypothetical protein F8O06_07430 [Pseudoclavibacter sp. CFCC 14310]KAB1646126.1 hypothetical protein F8O06_05015 [Pseudoclavibacter sp. CFCC 14310]
MMPKPRPRRTLVAHDTVTSSAHSGVWVVEAIFRARDEPWRDTAMLRPVDEHDRRRPVVRLERLMLAPDAKQVA